jgi:exosortase A-associated hydrolase 2
LTRVADAARLEPAFVAGSAGRLFTILYHPSGAPRGTLLVVPPFAEEMNRVRRSVALIGRALGAAGLATVVPDLYGTGDSEGDFADARWGTWVSDLAAVTEDAKAKACPITHVLAIRTGALLAFDALRRGVMAPRRWILWQPAIDGRRALDQFLRLRVAAEMANAPAARTSVEQLRGVLSGGTSLEVAGYEVHPALAASMDEARLEAVGSGAALTWLEVSASPNVSVPAEKTASAFRAAGWQVEARTIPGAPVWSTPETTVNDALNEATVKAIIDEHGR